MDNKYWRKYCKLTLALSLIGFGVSSLSAHETEEGSSHEMADYAKSKMVSADVNYAVAVLQPTKGNSVNGTVYFKKTQDGVKVWGTVHNLTPGKHGFHIHQFGDISKEDGTSAGGHFNPTGVDHAGRMADTRHKGDLGNITADDSGTATFEYVDKMLKLNGPDTIIGRGLIVHAGEDDLVSQPTGAAGARVAMAVIGVGNK